MKSQPYISNSQFHQIPFFLNFERKMLVVAIKALKEEKEGTQEVTA